MDRLAHRGFLPDFGNEYARGTEVQVVPDQVGVPGMFDPQDHRYAQRFGGGAEGHDPVLALGAVLAVHVEEIDLALPQIPFKVLQTGIHGYAQAGHDLPVADAMLQRDGLDHVGTFPPFLPNRP